MTTFFKKIIKLLLPVCLFMLVFEYVLVQVPNTYNKKREYFESQADSVQVLILGSSQAFHGINPEYLSFRSFNLSNVNQSLYYDTKLTLKYIDKMKNLKCVMVSISYFSFFNQLHDGIENWRDYYYARFWNVKSPEIKYNDPKLYSLSMLYTPLVSLNYAAKLFVNKPFDEISRYGWAKIDTVQNNTRISDKLGEERVKLYENSRIPSRFREIYDNLDNFVRECKNRNIDVVFITPPVLPTYYKFTNPALNTQNTNAVNKLCGKYNCKYFDYFRDSRF